MDLKELLNRAHNATSINVSNDILSAAVKEREEDAARKAVVVVKGLLENFEQLLRENVARLREIRKMEKAVIKTVADLDRALKYFGASGNPLPFFMASGFRTRGFDFCSRLGIEIPAENDDAWKVPEDFNPES